MPTKIAIQNALKQITSQSSFFSVLLDQTLGWPVSNAEKVEDISYSWSAEELNAAELERKLIDGIVWQIQPLEHNQPWGIFVLEFKNAKLFTAGRGTASVLRKILRGLVSSRRKQAGLPSWKREHLLFICTLGWTEFRFAYFRSKADDPRSSRLTTFGWEPESSNRTVCEFNLPALVWPEDPTKTDEWVTDWARAFDKDRLTNDFFKRFDQALDLIKSDLRDFQNLKPDDAYTQAQLLLERLIFLYFLQNRGWLKQDNHYLPKALKEHSKQPESFSFYASFLEKVFWSLSTPPLASGDRDHGLPFLNGGLFDDDEFDPSERRKKTSPPLRIRNSTFEKVFRDLLEAFNFTVTEDTPLNQEVAVDPEMLGKVFESIVLQAEDADPDATAPDKRKATGSYYTPRIVVHFICQEVLYQYLKNHLSGEDWGPLLRSLLAIDSSDGIDETERESLKKMIKPGQAAEALKLVIPLRCCDPAIGSGAFPVGLLHELVNLRRVLQTVANGFVDPVRKDGSVWLQKTKQEIVQSCLFGVDIQQQAIEICRLRLWLSLVVDYDLGIDPFNADKAEFNRAIEGISQLPNLEMNFHRGDSLHDHISGVPIVIMPEKASHYASDFEKIAELGEQLHQAKRSERKRKLRLQILERRLELSCRILGEEIRYLDRDESALETLFHDETDSTSQKRKRISHEKSRLQDALRRIEKDRKDLEKLSLKEFDGQFYVKLRKLEGADFDSPFNFSWYIDFPGIFGQGNGSNRGFDIIVGNPPFVTARNPIKRELWRERWPRVCHKTYQLLCPFFELSFGLLRPNGELGFIVSNAFAKREFGAPLVEVFFPTVELQKVIDCSGLLFPGHGTPTCFIWGANRSPNDESRVRVAAILPGGGDLRTAPEDSPLWHSLSEHHDDPGFSDARVVVADRPRSELAVWPWRLDSSTAPTMEIVDHAGNRLSAFVRSFGSMFDTHKDDVFFISGDSARRHHIEVDGLASVIIGDQIRNWSLLGHSFVLKPYDEKWKLRAEDNKSPLFQYLQNFRSELGGRATFGGKTYKDAGEPWFRFHQMSIEKITAANCIVYPEISTHAHFKSQARGMLFTQTAPVLRLANDSPKCEALISAVANSSTALFWLKQVAFNKGAGKQQERDRFEFAAGKLRDLPVPNSVADGLRGEPDSVSKKLIGFAQACSALGEALSGISIRKLFESETEAYQEWNQSLPGYVSPNAEITTPFADCNSLRETYARLKGVREKLRGEMIAYQEEMDWLSYSAYGLLPGDHAAVQTESESTVLTRDERPFSLYGKTQGDLLLAVESIPSKWTLRRKNLWKARLTVISSNEHIRRIEQPVYKRRWDEQWKVGNQWRFGSIAYAAEFVEAFEWWLMEKSEWWLENKKNGGPVEFDNWAQTMWKDARINAAWTVAAEEYAKLRDDKTLRGASEDSQSSSSPTIPATDFVGFKREFKRIVDTETVAEKIPFAIPYEELEKKLKRKIPGNVLKVRGKLNVPRERFHLRDKTQYLWAGQQFDE